MMHQLDDVSTTIGRSILLAWCRAATMVQFGAQAPTVLPAAPERCRCGCGARATPKRRGLSITCWRRLRAEPDFDERFPRYRTPRQHDWCLPCRCGCGQLGNPNKRGLAWSCYEAAWSDRSLDARFPRRPTGPRKEAA